MSDTLYHAAVTAPVKSLAAFSAILDKAAAHCETRKIDPAILLQSRLYPDMLPFTKQVQIAGDMSKGMVARLAGADIPSYADDETSFDALKARLAKTIAFMESVAPDRFAGAESRAITLKVGDRELAFDGVTYLFSFALPNVYFHITTGYALLRHNGVEIGKRDFLGGL